MCSRVTPTKGYSARIPYLLLFFVTIVFALVVKIFLSDLVIDLYVFGDWDVCKDNTCAGNQGIFRFSFALAMFFLTTFSLMLSPTTSSCHHSLWIFKMIYFLALIIIAFILPNEFYAVYANISRGFSAIFLLLQVILLVDFAYRWNESWVEKDQKKYYIAILAFCAFFFALSISGWILFFRWFGSENCGLEQFFIAFTIVTSLAFTLLSISGINEYGALLPSSILTIYNTYVLFNSLQNNPDAQCNSFLRSSNESDDTIQIVIGLFFASASITYSTWSLSSKGHKLFGTGDDKDNHKVNYDEEIPKDESDDRVENPTGEETNEELDDPVTLKVNTYFHAIMFMASMYMAMLLTNWASDLYSTDSRVSATGKSSMWVNIVCQWVTTGVYVWTLIAPKVLPNRDWD